MNRGRLPPLIQAMLQKDFYPHTAKEPQLLQTHISWVILTGPFAYKVKKPVDLGFVNFSTLARRKLYCERELASNRRLAHELYLEVLSISDRNGAFLLDSDSNIIEYCIKMVQFDQSDLLDQRLAAGRFDPEWVDILAQDIAVFHSDAQTSPEIAAYGDIHFIRDHILANLEVAEHHMEAAISRPQLDHLRSFCAETLHQKEKNLALRQIQGFIRVCHGDLHLRNIALFKGRPCVFDCIEFNDEYRMIDTVNDVAFMVMDCEAKGRPDLAMRFLSRYLEYSADYGGLELLPIYLTYRAGVRGKVACLLADEMEKNGADAQLHEARRYFSLAERYTRTPNPRLIVIGGLSGSGKSHLALIGAGKAPAIVIRSDATRKRLAKKFPDLLLYGPEMGKRTYDAMFKAAGLTLSAGYSVILDATFLRHQDRDRARDLANLLQIPCDILWLDIAVEELRQRISTRSSQGTDISDADLNVLEMQLAEYERPDEPDVCFIASSDRWPQNN